MHHLLEFYILSQPWLLRGAKSLPQGNTTSNAHNKHLEHSIIIILKASTNHSFCLSTQLIVKKTIFSRIPMCLDTQWWEWLLQ